jgi:hypothetical protein
MTTSTTVIDSASEYLSGLEGQLRAELAAIDAELRQIAQAATGSTATVGNQRIFIPPRATDPARAAELHERQAKLRQLIDFIEGKHFRYTD